MEIENNKILIAVDGSHQSIEAVRYISKAVSPVRNTLVLYHVYSEVPEPMLDFQKTSRNKKRDPVLKVWSIREQKMIQKSMKQAYKIIIENGFKRENVKIKTQPKGTGIARDIILEARKGYRAVVVGRKGISNYHEISIGSIANKIIQKIKNTAVIVVGGSPLTSHVLIANDGSKGAMKGVACYASLAHASESMIHICHVIRDPVVACSANGKSFSSVSGDDWMKAAAKKYRECQDKAKYALVNAGIAWSNITSNVVLNKNSRAVGLIEEARENGCETIIAGRRGHSLVKDFFMGRVSNKLLQLGDRMAMWIVN